MTLKELVENYINGNISVCRKAAKSRSVFALVDAFENWAGYTTSKSLAIAKFLKTGEGWQAACDMD